ncbi:hypothetical protein AB0B89_33425 [Sphaerisporangium sp. NPDC049002]|uniref:hypothetical protein n=1 Tax=unclassified Sphaerisporangium TaxID=2630420 RepID=UPI0033E911C3
MTTVLVDAPVSLMMTGVVGRVVYGGLGKLLAGVPFTPESTMFHTPLTQPPI